ncbi:D-proline reductase (dithiol) PrdB [Sporohalobacter salinus]|nr:D-proline reductase (dithiol) PrdB [Sporohalobacter salinus]
MSQLTTVEGMQSEIYVPITPDPVWTPVEKDLEDMTVALATAAGVHLKSQERFNLAGDSTFREVPGDASIDELMVTHGGYDQADVNKDINCMFPLERLRELADEGFIGEVASVHAGFMGGGGDQQKFKQSTGPQVAETLKEADVDAVLLTAG